MTTPSDSAQPARAAGETAPDLPREESAQVTFADLGVDERVLRALSDSGYEAPSPIQAAAIPPLMAGRHLVGLAQTGTGKTAAFAVPILSRIDVGSDAPQGPQALVLAPTRELALQVAEAFGRYAHHIPGLHILPIYGGQSYGVQLSGLRRGAHIVVGTPGRVIDHLNRGTLDLSQLRFLVLDEADEMLNMGFQEDVEAILATTPADKQVALFSATMPEQIRRISQRYLTDATEVTVANRTVTAANTRQRYILLGHHQKLDALTRVLEVEPFEAMIVFVRTKQATEDLAERLRARGFSAAAINGDLAQVQRERAIEQLRSGALDILVATDVAARGLDVERISHVLNYDIPHDAESYVHRVGRTGRAGRAGEALLFVTPRERYLLSSIERATRQPITEIPLPSAETVNSTRVSKFHDAITAHLESPEAATFRALIDDYTQEHDVPAIEIAAALAVISQGGKTFLLPPDPDPALRPPRSGPHTTRTGSGGASGATGPRRPRSSTPLATYRISVGRRHRVQPGAIVGAIANEGGLGRSDFGQIDIHADHTLVELPADLSRETVEALTTTRIGGKLIRLTKTDSRPANPPQKYRKRPGSA
jgi:ATP-dependent RNA helicase DeaD